MNIDTYTSKIKMKVSLVTGEQIKNEATFDDLLFICQQFV